jgi:hypothetical protein
VLAVLAWAAVGWLFTNVDPASDSSVVVAGAVLLGAAVALTVAPVLWIAAFAGTRRIAYRGDWIRAARRAALCGLVVFLLVLLRAQDALTPPMALFVIGMPVLVEITLSVRRW